MPQPNKGHGLDKHGPEERLQFNEPKELQHFYKIKNQNQYRGGEYQGPIVKELVDLLSPKQKIFHQDDSVPADRKLIVTENVMDSWIAAHYGITSLDKIPLQRPPKMPKHVYDRLRKYIADKKPHRVRQNIFGTRPGSNSIDSKQNPDQQENRNFYRYHVSPPGKFNQITFPKDMEVDSFVVQMVQQEIASKKSRFLKKNN